MYLKVNSLILALGVLASGLTLAQQDDFKQPLHIDSDHQSADGKRNIAVWEKNVKIRQGSLAIDADFLQIERRSEAGNEILIARGKPATYQQTLDSGKTVKAQANEIRYERSNNQLVLSGDAQFSQDGSLVQSKRITYNINTQQMNAESGEGKQVTTVLQPTRDQ